MTRQPLLSIVTPTLGEFSSHWLEQLLKIDGDVEFILVYPPGIKAQPIEQPRIKVLYSLYKGETAQRFVGLLNASGKYIIALDDDDYLHPEVAKLTQKYFAQFSDSWVLRLYKKNICFSNESEIKSDWEKYLDLESLEVATKRKNSHILQEVPIAPLDNSIKFWSILNPYFKRKDHHGAHIENFNNKIWQTHMVQNALNELSQNMRIKGVLTWLPLWGFDRLLGLYIQGKFFEKNKTIGHWMPSPEQVRYVKKPRPKHEGRTMFASDYLLARSYPKYGYFWNLFLEEFFNLIKSKLKQLTENFVFKRQHLN
jgi:glycosyltransferase involved in cell wall biosynthesis